MALWYSILKFDFLFDSFLLFLFGVIIFSSFQIYSARRDICRTRQSLFVRLRAVWGERGENKLQIGPLHRVFHLWAYSSLVQRNETRQEMWAKPGWDHTVAYTVPLIKKMDSKILIPTEMSQLK
uniref:NIPSNAP domain-containing protein n=1 Tax=Parascaris equorum TaxID=6256 RepID=A0A914RNP1_PAREQ